ncbi:hypothetical protein, partial [Nocardia brevicatena]|uniref:hypothetical protein n=1 Tax=Nocardia brevicatena TaxID=37327 RepID=UPI001C3F31A4
WTGQSAGGFIEGCGRQVGYGSRRAQHCEDVEKVARQEQGTFCHVAKRGATHRRARLPQPAEAGGCASRRGAPRRRRASAALDPVWRNSATTELDTELDT